MSLAPELADELLINKVFNRFWKLSSKLVNYRILISISRDLEHCLIQTFGARRDMIKKLIIK